MSKNLTIICLLEALQNAKRRFLNPGKPVSLIENIDHFKAHSPTSKRALISLTPVAWLMALREYPAIKQFNVSGLTYIMVKVLNGYGYTVDIVDRTCTDFQPTKRYDIFIGHGGRQTPLVDLMRKNNTLILQYVSTAHLKEALRQSTERYENLCSRKGVPLITAHARPQTEEERQGEDFLSEHAKYLFTGNSPRMIKAYGKYTHKIRAVGWAAYVEDDLIVQDRDFDEGRKGFIYVAGNLGNVQKGLDVLLDTFARTPELNLYIYCNVEEEVRQLFRKELSLPNIRYIYHYRFSRLRRHLRAILKRVNFTITAPIDSGIGTAFLGSVGVGLIPVGFVDMPTSPASSHLADSWQIESLVRNVREASRMPVEWCRQASALSMQNYRDNWSPQVFEKRFSEFMGECISEC